MITKMKKLTFLIYHKDYECFLQNIRDLGVVHVAEKAQGTAENTELQESIRLSDHYASTIKFLQGFNVELQEQKGDTARGEKALEEVEALQLEKTQLQHQLQICDKERAALEVWGDFDPASVMRLQEVGYQVNFYICSEKNFNEEWLDTYYATEVNRIGSRIYFITITKEGTLPELEVESVKLPVMSLSRLAARCEDLEQQMKSVDDKLAAIAGEKLLSLQVAQANIRSQIEFSKVVLSTEQAADDKLMLLQGWAPATQIPEITNFLNQQEAYFEIADPTPEDNVPIQLNNKGFFRLFEPIMKLYMLPKYNELDLTPFFAPFFMLFFGLCLGDSGYGLFMVLGVTVYRMLAKNVGASMKPILTLVQILGASTFFCGMLTGTFFGFNLYGNDIPFFNKMRDLSDHSVRIEICIVNYRMDYCIGKYSFGIPIGRYHADGRNCPFGNSGACRCADFLAQQSRKEYFSQYRFGFVGFLQYGNRFAGGYPFVCAFVCFRSVGWYSCQRIQ